MKRRIKLCISASTTEITELDVKQVKYGLEARLRSTQAQFCSVLSRKMICAQPNTFGLFCACYHLTLVYYHSLSFMHIFAFDLFVATLSLKP
jgi:hypothetical protein